MAKTADDVMDLIKDQEVKFVDLRFCDFMGKEQHVSVPVSSFDEDKFEEGHAFDGSSIRGWKGIEASDMLLMPDPDSARMDPFTQEPTLILTCDVVDPANGKGYERDPRSVAKRAEAYLKSTGIGDTAFFGPEPEFFILTVFLGKHPWTSPSLRFPLTAATGPTRKTWKAEIQVSVLQLKAGTSRLHRQTALTMCVLRCASASKNRVYLLKYITTKWAAQVNAKLELSSAHW